jgi:hypothetical protein
MRPTIPALAAYLRDLDPHLFETSVKLRGAVADLVGILPQTVAPFWGSALDHSDTVIAQLSLLLFQDGDLARPHLPLNAIEAYVLLAAAYLHDLGIVVSDTAKSRIMASVEWAEWCTAGATTNRSTFLPMNSGSHAAERGPSEPQYVAEIEARISLTQLIRRSKVWQPDALLQLYPGLRATIAPGDPVLHRVIENVCLSAATEAANLYDRERFPVRTNVKGKPLNARLLAALLRLGELLDLENDRACPALLNSACPVPEDHYICWSQFQRVAHIAVTPEQVEIAAHCLSQAEHRAVHDWCAWMVDECSAASELTAPGDLHGEWRPPAATIDQADATIVVQPAPGATYIPSRWKFSLDEGEILNRLVQDLYTEPNAYIRELLQNAADATRCRMYRDLERRGADLPRSPSDADAAVLDAYPIALSLSDEVVTNELSGETETRQVLTIDDSGIGMDRDIIARFLLQVGRSYYRTSEFRGLFKFGPASRFGLGFLSVFAVSDHVVIDTYKPESPACDGPLRLELVGPRTEILTERGDRTRPGTRIRVRLRERLQPARIAQTFTDLVRQWCPRLEFPIHVDDNGLRTIVKREVASDFEFIEPDEARVGATYEVRAHELCDDALEGEIYIRTWREAGVESWLLPHNRFDQEFPKFHPLLCLHGLFLTNQYWLGSVEYRCDYRGNATAAGLSHANVYQDRRLFLDAIEHRFLEVLMRHLESSPLANGPRGWRYRNALAGNYKEFQDFWTSCPQTIPLLNRGKLVPVSADAVLRLPRLRTIFSYARVSGRSLFPQVTERRHQLKGTRSIEGPVLLHVDIEALEPWLRGYVLSGLAVTAMESIPGRGRKRLLITWDRKQAVAGGNVEDTVIWKERRSYGEGSTMESTIWNVNYDLRRMWDAQIASGHQ